MVGNEYDLKGSRRIIIITEEKSTSDWHAAVSAMTTRGPQCGVMWHSQTWLTLLVIFLIFGVTLTCWMECWPIEQHVRHNSNTHLPPPSPPPLSNPFSRACFHFLAVSAGPSISSCRSGSRSWPGLHLGRTGDYRSLQSLKHHKIEK